MSSCESIAAVLFDLDGVLYVGDRPVAGGREAIAWFQAAGIPHLFVTNTTSKPREGLVSKLAGFGIEVEASRILTPPVAARRWLEANVRGAVALFVPEATRVEFEGLPLLADDAQTGAGAVVIGDLASKWDFATLNRAFRLLMSEPRPVLVALGMTRYWRTASGLQLDVAPFVVALEHATGREAKVLGKPAAPFFEVALSLLGSAAASTVMVGDDIRGDVGAAQALGMPAVLVRTGKFEPGDLGLGIEPDAVIDSIADFPRWWQQCASS